MSKKVKLVKVEQINKQNKSLDKLINRIDKNINININNKNNNLNSLIDKLSFNKKENNIVPEILIDDNKSENNTSEVIIQEKIVYVEVENEKPSIPTTPEIITQEKIVYVDKIVEVEVEKPSIPEVITQEKIVYVDKIVEVEVEVEKPICNIPYIYTDHTSYVKTMRIVNRGNKRNFIIELYRDSIEYDKFMNIIDKHFIIKNNDNVLFDSKFNDGTILIFKDVLQIYGRNYNLNDINIIS